jgi:hypothetical protein
MYSKNHNIMMAGMLLLIQSIPMPLYSADNNRKSLHSDCSDYVFISGNTNVNQFNFAYNSNGLSSVNTDYGSYEIEIPVKDFVPSNLFMYNDFLSLLKADEYPFINISIPQNQLDFSSMDFQDIKPDVRITIAGIARTYKLNCSIKKCSSGMLIIGDEELKLSDFNLKRVEKLGGLIKLEDEINVSFGFIVNFTALNLTSSQR